MIAMMYLVLTAMLALNVSKEILDAFVTVNCGLENTGKSFDKDIATLYSKFEEKKYRSTARSSYVGKSTGGEKTFEGYWQLH